MIEFLTTETFKEKVFNYEKHQEWQFDKSRPLVVNFTASWCGPCQMFAPILEELASSHADQLSVYKVDIDATPEISALFGIRSVPTTLFLVNGQEPAMASGVIPREALAKAIQEILSQK